MPLALVLNEGGDDHSKFPGPPYVKPQPVMRWSSDVMGKWIEIGIRLPSGLSGSAAGGWPLLGNMMQAQSSVDLVNWRVGDFEDAAGSPVSNGDGTSTYWARAATPLYWNTVVLDLHALSNRQGKSVTNIKIGGVTVSLPGYPYAMPASAATLQADLIAAGYAGAVVTSVAADLSIEIHNHYLGADNMYTVNRLDVFLSGSNVTSVENDGVLVTLPSYPYAMPAQRATLQADLIAAGVSGAVVKLYDDEWSIFLPDRTAATSAMRYIELTITPDDPHPQWGWAGVYQGIVADATIQGTYDNIRPSVGGVSLQEATKQFFRY